MLQVLPQYDEHCIFPLPSGDGRIKRVVRDECGGIALVLRAPAHRPCTTVYIAGVDWDGLVAKMAANL